ncbi:T9SS type A sorting domain-containing protein [candidate division KSB1 bacterium]|nr:T9SS type A sorting domain-containing protein [candidate division KSB1 bacterium]
MSGVPFEHDGELLAFPFFGGVDFFLPQFLDLEGDGDLDMLLGNLEGRFVYYENLGAPNAPAFHWVSDNYQNLRAGLYATAAPVFVDIDADGDLDLFSGDFYYGRIAFFENRGTPQTASFVVNSSNFQGIDVGNVSAPYFADGDRDGDFDLYVGKDNGGTVNIYENLGSPQQPNFVKRKALTHPVPIDDSVPCLYDWDNDGFLDLFLGQRAGKILYYRGTAVLDSFVFVSSTFGGIDVGLNSAPRFVDWDNDKRVDLIVGEQAGGLNYFRAPVQAHVDLRAEAPRAFSLHAYPNPFAKQVTVRVNANAAHFRAAPRLRVYNLLGAVVAELNLQQETAETWRAQWLPNTPRVTSGVYFVEVKWGKVQFTRKIFYLPQ